MNIFKTLFGKLFATYLIVTLVILTIIPVLSSQLLLTNNVRQKSDELKNSIDGTNQYVIQNISGTLTGRLLIDRLTTKASERGSYIIIFDEKGNVWLSVSGSGEIEALLTRIQDRLNGLYARVKSGQFHYDFVPEGGSMTAPLLIACEPIMVNNTFVGASYEIAEVSAVTDETNAMLFQVFLSGAVALFVALILIYFTARTIQRPLKQITISANELARGNFKTRVETNDKTEVGELARTFNWLCEELEKHEYQRSSFVANVSHELRSPMTSIQGLVQGVLDGTIPENEREQYLSIVLDETKRLSVLVNDLLDLSKLESGQFVLHREPLDVADCLCRALITFETKIDAKRLEVCVDIPEDEKLIANADRDRLMQVFTNLIDNAVKFANEGGRLSLSVAPENGFAVINIGNTGEIIAADDLPFVFDRFFKADKSHNRNKLGSGIGLSIVKSIVSQHDGSVCVRSNEAEGTIFTIKLPAQASEARREQETEEG